MKNINHILVFVDFSSRSHPGLTTAVNLAARLEGKVHLVHFLGSRQGFGGFHAIGSATQRHMARGFHEIRGLEKLAQKRLKNLMEAKVPDAIQGDTYIIPSSQSDKIGSIDYDLVVAPKDDSSLSVGSGMSNIGQVIDKLDAPVLAIGKDMDFDPKRILIATDLGRNMPERLFALAKFFQNRSSEIHFVNVAAAELITKKEIRAKIDVLAMKNAIDEYQVHVVSYSTEEEGILAVADDIDAGLILMKTYDQNDFWSLTTGSLALKVLQEAERPVMVESI